MIVFDGRISYNIDYYLYSEQTPLVKIGSDPLHTQRWPKNVKFCPYNDMIIWRVEVKIPDSLVVEKVKTKISNAINS